MASIVLQGGPSDHKPFIQDFRFTGYRRAGFRAVTYNVNHGSSGVAVRDFMDREVLRQGALEGPSVLLLQEVKPKHGLEKYLKAQGYDSVYAAPEFMVAWDRGIWEYVRHNKVQMSPTRYWTINHALVVVLRHKETGLLIKFMSYHTPAHVQAPRHKTFDKVSKVLREAAAKWKRMVRRAPERIDAHCFAGDDNVDETRGYAPKDDWAFLLDGPLTQIQAPSGTHGREKEHGRKIDDFRIDNGIRAV
jgi:hypothetical protein